MGLLMRKMTAKNIVDDHDCCGFIYPAFDKLLHLCKYLNLVELFKYIAKVITPQKNNPIISIRYSRIAVDIFIVSKWLFLLLIILLKINTLATTIIIWYLLIMNLYTYFFYHVWDENSLIDDRITPTRIKRRFFNIIISILYTIVGFAYLYYIPYFHEYSWRFEQPTFKHSLIFSISNSLTAGYNVVEPASFTGFLVATIQLTMMFIFLTVIIAGSIPQMNSVKKEG